MRAPRSAECVRFFRRPRSGTVRSRHSGSAASAHSSCGGNRQNFGRLLPTPKAGWSGVDVLGPLRSHSTFRSRSTSMSARRRSRNCGSAPDVAATRWPTSRWAPASAARWRHRASMARMMHAEMGHIPVRRDPRDAEFAGCCPFHGDCLEGLASGPAIRARWGCNLDSLPADHEGPFIIAGYLGQMAASIALHALGGANRLRGWRDVGWHAALTCARRPCPAASTAMSPALKEPDRLASYICGPGLGAQAGIAGALLLAQRAAAARA